MTRAHLLLASLFALCLGAAIGAFGGPALGADAQARPDIHAFVHQLSEGQRLMFFAQMQKETQGLSDDQRRAFRKQEREKLLAMSDSDRHHFAADLQAKWDALSPADQAKVRAKEAAVRAERRKQRQGADKSE